MQAKAHSRNLELLEMRLDKWLVYARFCKTRILASQLVAFGKVRINSRKIEKPDAKLRLDDILTLTLGDGIQLMRVLKLAERRGSAQHAQAMYEIMPQSAESLA